MSRKFSVKSKNGFTLIEVVVSMGIFVIITMITSYAFQSILKGTVTQAKTAESNMEGLVGLEVLRSDLEHAGYGLPWSFAATPVPYKEVNGATTTDGVDPGSFNDVPPAVPRALVAGTNLSTSSNTVPLSDYLVIKSTRVALDAAAKKWNYVKYASAGTVNKSYLNSWGGSILYTGDWLAGEQVISVTSSFTSNGTEDKKLAVKSDGTFSYAIPTFSPTPGSWVPPDDAFKPSDSSSEMIVYGVADAASTTSLRMPYNRADYYIDRASAPAATCSPGTGTLTKAVVDQATGAFIKYPLLDCVGDLQVVYYLDMNDDGAPGTYANATGTHLTTTEGAAATQATVQATLADAGLLRSRLKQVIVYLLAHEGRRDPNFQYPVADANNVITVGDPSLFPVNHILKQSDLATMFGPNWNNYRWKIFTVAVTPKNLF